MVRSDYGAAFSVVPMSGCKNKNGQRVVRSFTMEFEASHEQNSALIPIIASSLSAGIARGRPSRPSSPIARIRCLYHCRWHRSRLDGYGADCAAWVGRCRVHDSSAPPPVFQINRERGKNEKTHSGWIADRVVHARRCHGAERFRRYVEV